MPLNLFYFTKKFRDEKSSINILTIGWQGATKSSFINGVHTLLQSENQICRPAVEGGAKGHVTKRMKNYSIPDTHLTLWDSWGVDFNIYTQNEVEAIIDGALPLDWTWEKQQHIEYKTNTPMMDSVIFFIPATAKPSELEQLQKIFTRLTEKGYNSIVVISRIDDVNSKLKEYPRYYAFDYPDKTLLDLKKQFAEAMRVTEDRTFYCVNYRKEDGKRTLDVEIFTYLILDAAFLYAKQFRKSFNRNTIGDLQSIPEKKRNHRNRVEFHSGIGNLIFNNANRLYSVIKNHL